MSLRQKVGIILCAVLVGVAAVIVVIGGITKVEMKRAGDKTFADIQALLNTYPNLHEPLNCTVMYYREETVEFMLIKDGQRKITAIRPIEGNTEYYCKGKCWQIDLKGVPTEKQIMNDPVESILANRVNTLLNDQGMAYSYHYAGTMPLPMWVYPGEYYLRCERLDGPWNMETMVRAQNDNQGYVRWSILNNSTVILYLYAWEEHDSIKDTITYLRGWGDIEEDVWDIFYD